MNACLFFVLGFRNSLPCIICGSFLYPLKAANIVQVLTLLWHLSIHVRAEAAFS